MTVEKRFVHVPKERSGHIDHDIVLTIEFRPAIPVEVQFRYAYPPRRRGAGITGIYIIPCGNPYILGGNGIHRAVHLAQGFQIKNLVFLRIIRVVPFQRFRYMDKTGILRYIWLEPPSNQRRAEHGGPIPILRYQSPDTGIVSQVCIRIPYPPITVITRSGKTGIQKFINIFLVQLFFHLGPRFGQQSARGYMRNLGVGIVMDSRR